MEENQNDSLYQIIENDYKDNNDKEIQKEDDKIELPSIDLLPPFTTIDRGEL